MDLIQYKKLKRWSTTATYIHKKVDLTIVTDTGTESSLNTLRTTNGVVHERVAQGQ